jgi:ABC-type molybdate transport system permease subunit
MIFATLIAVPAAYALTRCEFRGKAVAMQLMSLPLVFPMVVLGLALLLVFDSLPFHMTTSRLVIAHVILALAVCGEKLHRRDACPSVPKSRKPHKCSALRRCARLSMWWCR